MINEITNIIQGEGKTQGQYRTMIRMNECNLRCNFCDSKYTLGKGDKQINKLNHDSISSKLILSGGEPCLEKNWKFIEDNIFIIPYVSWIEVETNGTIIPRVLLPINLWNISPKPYFRMSLSSRLGPSDCEPILLSKKEELKDYIVKFVIQDEKDIEFMNNICYSYKIPNEKIWLMPYTDKDGIMSNIEEVYDLAVKREINFSSRLHVLIKGNKRGI